MNLNMGSACSCCTDDKVTEINIPSKRATKNQENTSMTSNYNEINEVKLFMDFTEPGPHQNRTGKGAASPSVSSIESLHSYSKLKLKNSTSKVEESNVEKAREDDKIKSTGKRLDIDRESHHLKSVQDLPPLLFNDKASTSKHSQPYANSNLELTRKVGEILDKLISPESSSIDVKKVAAHGRQSRLMHADINTVVSYDLTGKQIPIGGEKTSKKLQPKLITVQPYQEDKHTRDPSPETPPQFNVCKHGIPLADNLDDDEGGCIKCQRPHSRGGRELQGYLKFKRAERKMSRTEWAKNNDRIEKSQDTVERALMEFEEFHDSSRHSIPPQ